MRYDVKMRAFMGLMALVAAGCADQPSHPPANPTAVSAGIAAPAAALPAANSAVPATNAAPDGETQRLAKAKNLKVYTKDGKQLFCRSNFSTGSHIQKDLSCYTAEQLSKMDRDTQRQFDQMLAPSNMQGLGPAGISKP
jgi:hypothetical protein